MRHGRPPPPRSRNLIPTKGAPIVPDPFPPRRRSPYLPGTSLLVFPRRDGLPEDFSPYWPHGLDFSGQRDFADDDRAPSPPAELDRLSARPPAAPMQQAGPAVGWTGAPPTGSSPWGSMNWETPDVLMDARLRPQPLDDGRRTPDDAQGEPQLYDAEVPAFQQDLQPDSSDTHPANPLLTKVGLLHDAAKTAGGVYDFVSNAGTAKEGIDAAAAVAENRTDDADVASKGGALRGGKWWLAGVQREPGWAGSEFAWIVVTDDGFSVSRNPFDGSVDVTRQFQPAPVALRTPTYDQWNDPKWLRLERERLITERGAVGKAEKFAADVVTGRLFPGPSGILHDAVQWALAGKGGRGRLNMSTSTWRSRT